VEREPDATTDDERDLLGDPDEVDHSLEEELDERLQEEEEAD